MFKIAHGVQWRTCSLKRRKEMKILVIDDSPIHHESALQTLVGHELTIASTYDEAYELLRKPYISWNTVEDELKRRGFKSPYAQDATKEEKIAANIEVKSLNIELCPPPPFDAVFCDMFMPASKKTLGPNGKKYIGQEVPVGFALSLNAVLQGAKYVAVVTATNHHDHPVSAMLDSFASRCPHKSEKVEPARFIINGARVGYYHAPKTSVEGTVCPDCNGSGNKEECGCVSCNHGIPRPDCDTCNGTGRKCQTCWSSGKQMGKDWGKVLAHMLS